MQINVLATPPSDIQVDWLFVPILEEAPLPSSTADLDVALGGIISRLRESGDAVGKANELTPILNPNGVAASRVLLVGLGKSEDANRVALTGAAAAAARHATGRQINRLAIVLPEGLPGLNMEQIALAAGIGILQGCHGPGLRKSKQDRFIPNEICLVAPKSAEDEAWRGAGRASAEGEAVALAQELVNTPPCELYPATFAERAKQIAEVAGLECRVLDQKALESERMGSLLGVAQGSDKPPRFVVLRYRGGGTQTLGLVGKGVTFDSGGLSLKNTEQMLDMKCDMAGAAAVLGALSAIAQLRIPVNVNGYMPLVENMPSGKALKLGDVVKARTGKTIEIHNTDAEGRLILADALAYAVDDKVDHIVDLATLTGSCMIALGTEVAGVMSNDESWSHRILDAAKRAGELAWPLPMFSLYNEKIKSNVADIKNTGGSRYAGAITAAKFLEEFVGKTPWAHIDIAGPAWAEHESATRDAGGTGYGVRTLVELAYQYGT